MTTLNATATAMQNTMTSPSTQYALGTLSATTTNGKSWYEALARAWGQALDNQANTIEDMATALGNGADRPSDLTMLTTEAARMQFMSNSASTSINSVGQSLETVARKG